MIAFTALSIVPTIAGVLAFIRFIIPTREVLAVRKSKQLGELNPLPFATAILNTSGWVVYAVLTQNIFIFFGDAPGLLCSIWTTFSLYPHASEVAQDRLNFFLTFAGALWSCLAFTTLILNSYGAPPSTVTHLWGFAVSATQVLLMASPLSTLVKAIRQHCSASFHPGLNIMACITSTLWVIYAIVIKDMFVLVPNVLGALLSLTSTLVLLCLPRTLPLTPAEQQQNYIRGVEHAVELA